MTTSDFNTTQRQLYRAVMLGAEAPPCYTCKAPSTHVTTQITPAGYHAWQCDEHTPSTPAPLWGSDPGWQSHYESITKARKTYAIEESVDFTARTARKLGGRL